MVATWRANAACSRWLYPVFASVKDLMMKNIGLYFMFSSSLNRAALTETSETARYTKSVSLASGLARIGGSTRYCLIAMKALSHSSFNPVSVGHLEGDKE